MRVFAYTLSFSCSSIIFFFFFSCRGSHSRGFLERKQPNRACEFRAINTNESGEAFLLFVFSEVRLLWDLAFPKGVHADSAMFAEVA